MLGVELSRQDGKVRATVSPDPRLAGTRLMFAVSDARLDNGVPRGENGGRHLHHVHVVRSLTSGEAGRAVTLAGARAGRSLTVFAQRAGDGAVVAATRVQL